MHEKLIDLNAIQLNFTESDDAVKNKYKLV